MAGRIVTYHSPVPASPEALYEWHTRSAAFERLNPPWNPVSLPYGHPGVKDGAEVTVRLRAGLVPLNWKIRHRNVDPPASFEDVQVSGPFSRWRHTHRFLGRENDGSTLEDEIEFEFKGGRVIDRAASAVINELDRVFAYRHRVTAHDLAVVQHYELPTMRVGITGASGLLGSHLSAFLRAAGHSAIHFVRRAESGPDEIAWDPDGRFFDSEKAEGLDAVVHFAGESLFGVWTKQKKQRIEHSRIEGTRNLVRELSGLNRPPRTLISASGINFYGDRGDELLSEDSAPGLGFIPALTVAWEREAMAAADHGIRVVTARNGIVLSPRGGFLAAVRLPFMLGLGATVGSGREFIPWISIEDYLAGIYHCLADERISGPVNFASPNPATQRTFVKTLGAVLGRPTFLKVPSPVARLVPGGMGDELLLSSTRPVPAVLENSGFRFRFDELRPALEHVFGKTNDLLPESSAPVT